MKKFTLLFAVLMLTFAFSNEAVSQTIIGNSVCEGSTMSLSITGTPAGTNTWGLYLVTSGPSYSLVSDGYSGLAGQTAIFADQTATGYYQIYKFSGYPPAPGDPTTTGELLGNRSIYSKPADVTPSFDGTEGTDYTIHNSNRIYCEGMLKLSSEVVADFYSSRGWNVSYDLYKDAALFDTKNSDGSGETLTWTGLDAGTYTVKATRGECTNVDMTGSPQIILGTIEFNTLCYYDLAAAQVPFLEAVNAAANGTAMQAALELTYTVISTNEVNSFLNLNTYNTLVAGRKLAVGNDMVSNKSFADFAAVETLFDKLVDFRLAVQVAVDNGNAGTLTIAQMQTVNNKLGYLVGYKVNGQEVTNTNITDGQAGVDRLSALDGGRYDALVADLAANGPYTSFETMAYMLNLLLEFREEVQLAVNAANAGSFTVAHLQNVNDAWEDLVGKKINGVVTVQQNIDDLQAFIDALNAMETGRFVALVTDLKDNGTYGSFTQMYSMLDLLAQFRFVVADAVDAANDGSFTVTHLQDVNYALAQLVGAIINGEAVEQSDINDAQVFITTLGTLVPGRFAALVTDLAANGIYGSFTQMADILYPLANLRLANQVAVDAANNGSFTIQNLQDVNDALALLVGATVNGNEVLSTHISQGQAFIDNYLTPLVSGRFAALVTDLAANGSYGSFTEMADMLYPLANLRLAIQVAVDAANAGNLVAADFSGPTGKMYLVGQALLALDGKSISGESVDGTQVTATLAFFNAMDEPTQDAILAAINNQGFGSFTQLLAAAQAAYDGLPVVNTDTQLRYATIQGAINAASTNQTIEVGDGTFTENITIDVLGLTLKNSSAPIIDGGGSGIVVSITANNVTFQGFTVQNSGATASDAGIAMQNVTGCTVQTNIVTNNANGIVIAYGSGNTIKSNNVNTIGGYGVVLAGSSGNTVELNNISGVSLDALVIENNNVVGGDGNTGSNGNFIKTNTVATVGRDGLFIGDNCTNNSITDINSFSAITSIAVHVWRDGAQTITDNVIGSALVGIKLRGTDGSVVTGNTISGNGTGIEMERYYYGGTWYPCQNNTISSNDISGNTTYGMYAVDNDGVVIVAENNWWGDASGPYNNPYNTCGTGDEVIGNVSFAPWCLDNECINTGSGTAFAVQNINKGTYYCKIQDAIDDANPLGGDVIKVAAGSYSEMITIDKSLTLEGNGRDDDANATRLDCMAGILSPAERYHMMEVADGVSGVTVKGFRFEGNGIQAQNDYSQFEYAFRAVGGVNGISNITIKDNTFIGSERAIYLGGNLTYASVENNLIEEITDWWTIAITCFDATATLNNISIKGNEIRNSTSIPIVLLNYNKSPNYGDVVIEENHIHNNDVSNPKQPGHIYAREGQSAGILVRYDWSNVTIQNNVVEDNLDMSGVGIWGVYPTGSDITNLTIEGNTLKNNIGADRMNGDLTAIRPEYLASGISVQLTINKNGDKSSWSIHGNKILNNSAGFSYFDESLATPSGEIDATCNWWGTIDAYDVQDATSELVQFLPYSTAATPTNCDGYGPIVVYEGTSATVRSSQMTIQGGIDAAIAGDVINVAAGTYKEFVVIDKALTLQGAFSGTSGYDPGRDGNNESIIIPPDDAVRIAPAGTSTYLITNNAENVVVDGFTIKDEKDGSGQYGANGGILSTVGSFDAKNNRIVGLPKYGIAVHRSAGNVETLGTIVDVEISTNYITGTAISDLTPTWANAVSLLGAVADVLNNQIEQSRVGISVQPYNQSTVEITTDGLVSGNIFNTYSLGVFYHAGGVSGHYAVSGNWTFSNNEFNLITNLPDGIQTNEKYTAVNTRMSKCYFGKAITYSGNIFDVSNLDQITYTKTNIQGFTFRNDMQQHTAGDINLNYTGNTFTSDDFLSYFDRASDGYPTYPPMEIDLAAIKAGNIFTDGSIIFGYKLVPLSKVNVINITQDLGYLTIQAAIDEANAGDVIQVAAGTYDESLIITKPLTLQGSTTGAKPLINLPDGIAGIIEIKADNVIIDYLHIRKNDVSSDAACFNIPRGGSWGSYTIAYDGIQLKNLLIEKGRRGAFVTASNITIDKCEFLNQGRDAIYFDAVSGITNVSNNRFVGNSASSKKCILFENFSSEDPACSGTINITNNITGDLNGVNGKNNFFVFNQWINPADKVDINITGNIIRDLGSSAIVIYDWDPTDRSIFRKINSMSVHNNDLAGVPVNKYGVSTIIDPVYPVFVDATCNWFGTAEYEDIYDMVSGPVVYVPYLLTNDLNGACGGGPAIPTNLSVTYTQASENIVVAFDVTENDLELQPVPGLNPADPDYLDDLETLYSNLALAIASGITADIQAAALAIGDDIITEYYYMDGTNKVYLQTAGSNPLVKNKYWSEYLVRTSDSERYPVWTPGSELTLVEQNYEYRTSTNPNTGAVNSGWLNPVLGRELHVDLTFINNGSVNSIEKVIAIPRGPVNVFNTASEWVSSHMTIQEGIDASTTLNGYYVDVAPGTYPEVLYLYKELDIRGPNYGINPNTVSRNPEATIQFPPSSTSWFLVYIDGDGSGSTVTNVSLNGFKFDGVDSYGGSYPTELIFVAGAENVSIKNNILKNFEFSAIRYHYQYWDGTNYVSTWPVGADISENNISNPDFYSLGSIAPNTGIYLQGVYGSVTDNVVEQVLGACQIQPYGHPNTTSVKGTVTGNTFKGSRNGLWYNNSSSATADWLFNGNRLSGIPFPSGYTPAADWYGEPTDIWYGFAINGNSYGELAFTDNTIEKGTTTLDVHGIRYVHGYAHAPASTITSNTINDLDYGVYLSVDLVNVGEILINDNTISGNRQYGVYNATTSPVDATCNYWGSTNAYDVQAATSGLVQFLPYSTSDDPMVCDGYGPVVVYEGTSTTVRTSHMTIQDAIDDALTQTGDRVWLSEGTYTQNASTADGGTQVDFDGEVDGSGNPLATIKGNLSLDNADGRYIKNLRFEVDATELLTLKNTNGLDITDCIFDGNLNDGSNGGFLAGKNGINATTTGSNGNSDVTVEDCIFQNGLYVSISSKITNLTVKTTEFTNVKSGINHSGGNNLNVTDCSFSVEAQGDNNDTYGIRFASAVTDNLTVSGCEFVVDRNGFTATGGDYHAAVIIRAAATGSLVVNNSSILGDVVNLSATTLDATCNWWGITNGNEIEDLIAGNVTYQPWLVDGTDDSPDPGFQPVDGSCSGTPVMIDEAVATPETCGTEGSIQVSFSGGTTPFEISWTGTGIGSASGISSPYTITGLAAGDYDITITDTYGSSASALDVAVDYLPVSNITKSTNHTTIQAAIDAATAGDVIEVCAGNYTENLVVNKNLTINGPNAGTDPNLGSRDPEAVLLDGTLQVTGSNTVIIDGIHVYQTNNTLDAVLLGGPSTVTIQNSIIERFGVTTGASARGLTTSAGSGLKTIQNNLFTGDGSNLYSGHKTWNSGMYVNGGSSTLNISNNVFENCRTAINLDDYNANIALSGNTFQNSGTLLAFGGTTPTDGSYTLGVNDFKPAGAIINLSNVAETFRLDITSSKLNGTVFSDLDLAALFNIEAAMYHRSRSNRNGLVYYVADHLYVRSDINNDINTAISYAADADVILLNTGTFNQNVLLNKSVTVQGQGFDKTILTPTTSCDGIGVIISADNAKLKDLKVTDFQTGIAVSATGNEINNVSSVSNCNQGLELSNGVTTLTVLNSKFNDNTSVGVRKGTASVVSAFTMENCEVTGNNQGFFIAKNNGTGGTFDNVTITNCDFSNNTIKGMYIEALSNAVFDGITMNNSGTDASYANNNGININLKYGSYSNITIKNSNITNCGVKGTAILPEHPAAIAICARDDGSYSGNPATLNNVWVLNNYVTGPENGIRFGESGKENATPTNVTVSENELSYAFANKTLINRTSAKVDATCNWFGTNDIAMIANLLDGSVNVVSYLTDGTDGSTDIGFQPTGNCDGAFPVYNVTQNFYYPTIQAAVQHANATGGNDIRVVAGTFVESGQIVIDKDLSITGAGMGTSIVKTDQNTGTSGDARGWFLVNAGVTFNLSDLTLDGSGFLIWQAIRHLGKGAIDQVEFKNIKYQVSGSPYNGNAIAAFGSPDMNVHVTNSTFSEIGRVGVIYFGAGITGSDFHNNTYVGKGVGDWIDYMLDISAGAIVDVQNCEVYNNKGVASSDGSTSAGILVTSYFGAGTTATVSNCDIHDNTTGILVGFDANDVSVVTANNNKIYDNENGVSSTAPTVDAADNYWGDATGPQHTTHNTCGAGDQVTDFVDFYEWWANEAMNERYTYEAPDLTCVANTILNQEDDRGAYATGYPTATTCYGPLTITYTDNRAGLNLCNATGDIVRTFTVTDYFGHVSTCQQTLTIQDNTNPEVQCPADISQDTDTGECFATVDFEPTATDFGFFQGFEDAGWESVDGSGWYEYNSKVARVPSNTGGIVSKTGNAHAVINSTILPPAPDDYTGLFGRLGSYSNVFGDGYYVRQDVYFDLTDAAVIANTYGWDLSVASSNQTGGHLQDFIFHTASNASGNILVAASNNSNFTRRNDLAALNHAVVSSSGWYTLEWDFRDFGDGTLAVDCNLLDANGNRLWTETRHTATNIIASVVGGNRYIWFTFLEVDELAIDNTSLVRKVAVTPDYASGSQFNVGTTPITVNAADACSNAAISCSFDVTVIDNELPNAVCQTATVELDANGDGTLDAADVDGGSTDNCGIQSISVSPNTFTCGELGENTVTLTVTDIHGNESTCNATVTVVDQIAPTIACPVDITLCADETTTDTYTAIGSEFDFTASADNCSVASHAWELSGATTNSGTTNTLAGVIFNEGTTTVSWTAIDGSENPSTPCTFDVTVNPLPDPAITGSTEVIEGSTKVYSTPEVADHTYEWEVTGGTKVVSVVQPWICEVTWGTGSAGTVKVTETIDATQCSSFAQIEVVITAIALQGTITYKNVANTPMNNVTVNLKNGSGDVVSTTTTSTTGYYAFATVPGGVTKIEVETAKDWAGANSTDALAIQRKTIGNPFGWWNPELFLNNVADVNNSGIVNSTDALNVKLRTVYLINSFGAGDWAFWDATNEVNFSKTTPVVNNKAWLGYTAGTALLDIKAMCYGDVNGSYQPSSTKSVFAVSSNSVSNVNKNRFKIPVQLVGDRPIGAATIHLWYDARLVEIQELVTTIPDLLYTIEKGWIHIAWSNLQPLSLPPDGTMFTLVGRAHQEIYSYDEVFMLSNETQFADMQCNILPDVYLNINRLNTFKTGIEDVLPDYSVNCFPNPVQSTLSIAYVLPERGQVEITILNSLGETIAKIADNTQDAGSYLLKFDPVRYGLTNGVYYCRMQVNGQSSDFSKVVRIVYMK